MHVTLFNYESMNDLSILAEQGWGRDRTLVMLVCKLISFFLEHQYCQRENALCAKTDEKKG